MAQQGTVTQQYMLMLLYQFPTAAVTHYHRHCLQTTQVYYLTVLEIRSPKIGLRELKPRCGHSWFLLKVPGKNPSPFFQLLGTTAFLGLWSCNPPTSGSIVTSHFLIFILQPPFYKESCDHIGPTRITKILRLIPSAKSFLKCKEAQSQSQVLEIKNVDLERGHYSADHTFPPH